MKLPHSQNEDRKVVRNVRVYDLLSGYVGPDVILDFDKHGKLIGIEILLEDEGET